MIKSHKESRFVLRTLEGIRETTDIVLQIEDTGTQFTDGKKCYLCEATSPGAYYNVRNERDLIREICELNNEKRRLEKKVTRLMNRLEKMERKEDEGNES